MRNILSIRGGGIRGIIPCCCLIELESQLGGRTRDHFAYCGGTSTGALLTAAVAAGIPASDLLKVYTDRSKEIFTPTGLVAEVKRSVEGFMYDVREVVDELVAGRANGREFLVAPMGFVGRSTFLGLHHALRYRRPNFLHGRGFLEKIVDPDVHAFSSHLDIAVGGEKDDGYRTVTLAQFPRQLDAVFARHTQVRDYHVGFEIAVNIERALGRIGRMHLVGPGEEHAYRFTWSWFIIHQ